MKIFSAAQIRACDAYTIHASSIHSLDLMERAAAKCTEWLMAHFTRDTPFIILCGTGNNGGAGLAITRMLHQNGYGVKAFLLQLSESLSIDCQTNADRLSKLDESLLNYVQPDTFLTDLPQNIILIDAILGTGLNRPAEGWIAAFINHINQFPNYKIAIDIPSGLPADTVANTDSAVLKADTTISFQFYKRSFLHPEGGRLAGFIHILDIGLSQAFIQGTHTNYRIIDLETIRSFYQPRQPFTHKGDFGTALLIGGSYGMIGAVCLAAKAASRSGAGKVKALIPEAGYIVFQSSVPEAMCTTNGEKAIANIRDFNSADAIGIGPGLGTASGTTRAVETFIESYKNPLVIDADALNIIASLPDLLHKIPANSILTPHPKEFERIFGTSPNSMVRLELARTQAMRLNITIVLKDHHTAVITPEGECWYNITGNAGLATGGTGDVLTGIITSLLAQGYKPEHAALLGVHLHGTAADLALSTQSPESLTPQDVIQNLGSAFRSYTQTNPSIL